MTCWKIIINSLDFATRENMHFFMTSISIDEMIFIFIVRGFPEIFVLLMTGNFLVSLTKLQYSIFSIDLMQQPAQVTVVSNVKNAEIDWKTRFSNESRFLLGICTQLIRFKRLLSTAKLCNLSIGKSRKQNKVINRRI